MWHKHNLIIPSVGSGHRDRYLYEIPHKSGWKNLLEKIISTKRKRYFQCRIYSNFFRAALFLEKRHIFSE